MSLDARLSLLWIRLQNRFKTSQVFGAEPPRILESIQPITNADELLQIPKVSGLSKTFTELTTGMFLVFTVPEKKRWIAHTITAEVISGTMTIDRIVLYDLGLLGVTIWNVAAGTYINGYLREKLVLEAGWKLYVNIVTHTVLAGLESRIVYTEEDAY